MTDNKLPLHKLAREKDWHKSARIWLPCVPKSQGITKQDSGFTLYSRTWDWALVFTSARPTNLGWQLIEDASLWCTSNVRASNPACICTEQRRDSQSFPTLSLSWTVFLRWDCWANTPVCASGSQSSICQNLYESQQTFCCQRKQLSTKCATVERKKRWKLYLTDQPITAKMINEQLGWQVTPKVVRANLKLKSPAKREVKVAVLFT